MSKLPPIQLYDLKADVGEKVNVQDRHPEVVKRLTALLEKYAANGRSTPGPKQPNNGSVDIFAAGRKAHAARPPKSRPAKKKT